MYCDGFLHKKRIGEIREIRTNVYGWDGKTSHSLFRGINSVSAARAAGGCTRSSPTPDCGLTALSGVIEISSLWDEGWKPIFLEIWRDSEVARRLAILIRHKKTGARRLPFFLPNYKGISPSHNARNNRCISGLRGGSCARRSSKRCGSKHRRWTGSCQ